MADIQLDPAALLSEEGAVKLAELFTMFSGGVVLSHQKGPAPEFGCHVMIGQGGKVERSTISKATTLDAAVRDAAASVLPATASTDRPPPVEDSEPVASSLPQDDEGEWR